MSPDTLESSIVRPIHVSVGQRWLHGEVRLPRLIRGVVLFAHGIGSSHHSPGNRYLAQAFERRDLATVLIDLLTPDEDALGRRDGRFRDDALLLSDRIVAIVDWLRHDPDTALLPIGLLGTGVGGGGALVAAATRTDAIGAVVSRRGRLDLAGDALGQVIAPTLLIVGDRDTTAIGMHRAAMARVAGPVTLKAVADATHLLEDRNVLPDIAALAGDWFTEHLPGRDRPSRRTPAPCAAP